MCSKIIEGFKVIDLRFSESSTEYHQIFIKQHSVHEQTEEKPADKTLLVINIPPYATESSLKRIFSVAGPVKSVTFESKSTTVASNIYGFKTAYVVFERSAALYKALKLKTLDPLSTNTQPILTGMAKWINEYNTSITNQKNLRDRIKQVIDKYDKMEAKNAKRKNVVDDEGWIQVTKKGRRPGIPRTETNENRLKKKHKNQKKGLDDFYRFQLKEKKMHGIAAMREAYEEDKKRVEMTKIARKFKPN